MKNLYDYLRVNNYPSKSVFPFIIEFYENNNGVYNLQFELFETISEAKDFFEKYDLIYKPKN